MLRVILKYLCMLTYLHKLTFVYIKYVLRIISRFLCVLRIIHSLKIWKNPNYETASAQSCLFVRVGFFSFSATNSICLMVRGISHFLLLFQLSFIKSVNFCLLRNVSVSPVLTVSQGPFFIPDVVYFRLLRVLIGLNRGQEAFLVFQVA